MLNLTSNDFIKGLIVAILTAPLALIIEALQADSEIDLRKIGLLAVSAGLAYLLKNLGTDEQGKFIGKF
jgi:hypothetical protein